MSLSWLRDSYNIICIVLTVLDVVLSVSVRLNISASDLTDQGIPRSINVTINAGINSSTELELSRVDHINSNVPVYTLDAGDDGVQVERQNLSHNQDFAFYHDVQRDAIFQFVRQNTTERQKDELIIKRGEFQRGDARYSIQPTARSKRDASSTDDQSEQSYDLQPVVLKPAKHADHVEPPPELKSSLDAEFLKKFQGGARGNRRRRQSLSTYYIDITAFLDYTAYSIFLAKASNDADVAMQKIQEYFAFIFAGVDLIYQNFESSSFKLRVSLTKIVVLKNDRTLPLVYIQSCSFYTWGCTYTDKVDTDSVLRNFSKLMNTSEGRTLAFPYDHSMLFIGSDMWVGSVDILGLAWIKTICSTNGQSVSAIEEMGDYSSIITAAHELGHSLSAQHDGYLNFCSFEDRYLMASSDSYPTQSTRQHPWRFSICTVNYVVSYLTFLSDTQTGATCLSNTLPVLNEFPDVTQRLLGQEIPIEKQCQLTFGQYSYVCSNTVQSEICSELYCYSLKYGCQFFQAALSGTSCGCGKTCRQGACVETLTATDKYCNNIDIWKNCSSADCSNSVQKVYCAKTCRPVLASTTTTTTTTTAVQQSPTVPDGCYDDYHFSYNGVTCRTALLYSFDYCQVYQFSSACCATCSQRSTTVTSTKADGCYDDPYFGYNGWTCQTIQRYALYYLCQTDQVNSACCSTCKQSTTTALSTEVTTSTTVCADNPYFTFYGLRCASAMLSPVNLCYEPEVQTGCCRSCFMRLRNVKDCEYGDRDRRKCSNITTCQGNKYDCCHTCSGVKVVTHALAAIVLNLAMALLLA